MMNPSSNGWIKKYFSLVGDLNEELFEDWKQFTPEDFMYGMIQPTGLMYGFQSSFLFLPEVEAQNWSSDEKFKVLLLEGLLVTEFAHSGKFEAEEAESLISKFVSFYEETEIEKAKKNWLNFSELDPFSKLESIIDQRIDIKVSFTSKLWTNYINNSLVFQDLILYFEYRNNNITDGLMLKRSKMMLDMIKVVAVAAHADGEIAEAEEALFKVFMASARFDNQDRDTAKTFWDEGKKLEDISFEFELSPLAKKYVLEIATLTVWSDKTVVASEQKFLDDLSMKLGVDEDEQDKSFIAIQSYVLQNEDNLHFLSGKNEAEQLMQGATDKWKKILTRNSAKLATELKHSKELVQLIAKSTNSDLTKEEKKKVKAQFKDLAKSIPAFTLFMLPGGMLIMPLVLKIIPDLVPSAFRNNQVDDLKEEEE